MITANAACHFGYVHHSFVSPSPVDGTAEIRNLNLPNAKHNAWFQVQWRSWVVSYGRFGIAYQPNLQWSSRTKPLKMGPTGCPETTNQRCVTSQCLHRASWHSSATQTEVFPCIFLCCKANARVKPAKTRHGPHSYKFFLFFYVLFVLCRSVYCFCVNVYCTAATVCQPNCSYQIYHITSHPRPQITIFVASSIFFGTSETHRRTLGTETRDSNPWPHVQALQDPQHLCYSYPRPQITIFVASSIFFGTSETHRRTLGTETRDSNLWPQVQALQDPQHLCDQRLVS